MNILDKIVEHKKIEVEHNLSKTPVEVLKDRSLFTRKTNSLKANLDRDTPGIISEFKRKSPSKSAIKAEAKVEDIIPLYDGASPDGISVLTDEHYFSGHSNDLIKARSYTEIPLLRKDFIIDPYQIYESKVYKADAILLIASILDDKTIIKFIEIAEDLKLDCIVEIHTQEQIKIHTHEHN